MKVIQFKQILVTLIKNEDDMNLEAHLDNKVVSKIEVLACGKPVRFGEILVQLTYLKR